MFERNIQRAIFLKNSLVSFARTIALKCFSTFQSVRIWIKTFILKVLLSLILHVVDTYKFSLPKLDFKDRR